MTECYKLSISENNVADEKQLRTKIKTKLKQENS